MKRSLLLLGALLLPTLALAQIASPSSPTSTRGATTVTPPAAQPVPAQPPRPVQPSPPSPVQAPRPLMNPPPAAGPIRSTGPAQIAPPPTSTAPAKVYDRDGRIIPGVRPAGQNRVFDSRTGRYHDSVPQGADSKIKP
ncbi:classical arabinogalactan protein 4 [Stenotrophomonas sp. CFBP 13718]|uniref:classical arabinogalactan protein 4 n=1 Tax=Stenotrophomonas sp. CFBP 13718 TaxID=2775304 RepID=UPI00177C2FEB|nr:classical arabinogalactan protein 4 [Stenotrophomonas sp. CFBP 13718]MBD8697680.1 classical arabinogalactan protein 4 [Stenotrophomonas sp. CFBP 13718]